MKNIRIGSRESRLAVVQSEMVMDYIKENCPEYTPELVTMKTTGDRILDRNLDQIGGKGLFVKELDAALMDGRSDMSVHSLKDMPAQIPEELPLIGFSKREDPRDVLVLPEGHPLDSMAVKREGFAYPWLDLSLLASENFILLYPDQNTGGIALQLFAQYNLNPPVLLHTRNSEMSITLAMDGMGAAFAPDSYYRFLLQGRHDRPKCYSVGKIPLRTTTIAAHEPRKYLPQYARDYIRILQEYTNQYTKYEYS